MFTGIIQFTFLSKLIDNILFLYTDETFSKLISIGDSVAINGVCLTVVSIKPTFCTFYLSQETLNLCNFIPNQETLSNVELPLKYGNYIGGHLVSGHIHQTATFLSLSPDGNMWLSLDNFNSIPFQSNLIQTKPNQTKPITTKGSIAVNGVSLTIAEIIDDTSNHNTKIRIALIPETIKRTNLGTLKPNDKVNIEFDGTFDKNSFDGNSFDGISTIPSTTYDDIYFMKKTIEEGEKGRISAPPNPWVGCVIVKNNKIISSGYHKQCGEPHAEVNAINSFNSNPTDSNSIHSDPNNIFENIFENTVENTFKNTVENTVENTFKNTTMYVTLEPCCHHGRTPPCTDLLIQKKIARVVVGILDPDENVSGKGIAQLKNAGIEVVMIEDIDKNTYDEIKYNLRAYIFHRTHKRPYVIAKIGLTFDNCYRNINDNEQWITHEESRKEGHILRSQCQAIIIGGTTVQTDDPLLTIRLEENSFKQPLRVVIDGKTLTSFDRKIFKNNPHNTIVMTSDSSKWSAINTKQYEIIPMNSSCDGFHQVLDNLYQRNIMCCLIEGGGKLHYNFFKQGLVDELIIFKNPHVLGNQKYKWLLPDNTQLNLIDTRILNDLNISNNNKNIMEHYFVTCSNSSSNFSSHSSSNNEKIVHEKTIQKSNEQKSIETNIIETNIIETNIIKTPIEHAVNEFKQGNFVLIMDDETRENEGDLVVAASKITETQMTEMIEQTTGIICCPMEKSTAKKLNLPLMCENNTDIHKTAFTISVDHIGTGTGVSSTDRLMTVNALGNDNSLAGDFRKPGHIFPLIAHPDGLKARQGHTEASIALCKLAQIYPRVAVIGELQNKNGKMKSRHECHQYALKNKIPIITVRQLQETINNQPPLINMIAECDIQSKIGSTPWHLMCFGNPSNPHKVFIYNNRGGYQPNNIVPVRIHSECFTGDVFRSQHCDCGEQLKYAQKYIVNHGYGIIIFPANHEGRGIGITHKVKAYNLQKEKHLNTFEANQALGLEHDARTYDDIREILQYLKITTIELLTENTEKISALKDFIASTTPIIIDENTHNQNYLTTKRHFFETQNNQLYNNPNNKLQSNPNNKLQSNQLQNNQNNQLKKDHNPIIDLDIYDKSKIKNLKIAFVYSMWHSSYIEQIRNRLKFYFQKIGVENLQEFDVPGSNEVPFKASQIAKNFDGIVCIGILIKGDTLHFENVSTAVSNGIMQAQINSGIPMMNCVLSCLNMEQVIDRIDGEKSTLDYIARSLIKMILN